MFFALIVGTWTSLAPLVLPTHDEMKKHTGDGLGGGLALVLAIFIGIASPFLSSSEVGKLYERRGMRAPVSGVTGLWVLRLSWFFLVGAMVWFVKTNGALNAYWRSQGAN
jgi:Na+-transporting NADH:ubiquinone oxidoreductase subunit NqrD